MNELTYPFLSTLLVPALTDLHASGNYGVSWSGGESWGDMGVDFRISNHEITDEAWGD